jgi:hypothetical protein
LLFCSVARTDNPLRSPTGRSTIGAAAAASSGGFTAEHEVELQMAADDQARNCFGDYFTVFDLLQMQQSLTSRMM